MRHLIAVLALMLVPAAASAVEVFACEPEWAALVRELAGDHAKITVATTPFQDPHSLQARPSLIAAIRDADLVICSGADLEIGWLPLLLRRAGRHELFYAADYVRKLEVPMLVDRSQGDIHPQGNPHVHLDPRNIRRIAGALGRKLAEIDPGNQAVYEARLDNFQQRWADAMLEWDVRAQRLAGLELASHHKGFSYLAEWIGLEIVATLESKPGIPPSGAHLARLLEQLTAWPPAAIVRTPYENDKPSQWLSARLGIRAMTLPYTVGGSVGVDDLFSLYDETLSMLESLAS